ncbi:oxidative stress survival, Svf1-like protein [Cantharellus anzutake]|uniref:oxidative stress survival, Svf1-like protein n=1 Tax=Cantharellus anzutake TaxID=1750568 RepID=UPI0019067E9E|nr:oxidative stress survival, Svf1-like protein [Cantharellus anzutake]KAF8340564.1 oxidative stress survival, Svf1-like protein [Cantharellus anzutake]
MFSSLFSGSTHPHAPNFHPTVRTSDPTELFGELEPKDLEWTIGSGIVTETQTWYHSLKDGTFLLCQIIHSSVGMWYPTVQFTCKIWNPVTEEKTWKSINVANFVTPPPSAGTVKYDKRSSRSDQFTIIHKSTTTDPGFSESYTISANVDAELQITLVVSRPALIPGFKLGKGPKGGFSYFGADENSPEGYVVHRFWPRTSCSGIVVHKGQAIEVEGTGMFVHAIQGMRPDLIAASWNFCDFQSDELGGTSAIQMEFSTIDTYGRKGAGSGGVTVNVGSVVIGGKLASVTGEVVLPEEKKAGIRDDLPIQSRARHLEPVHDPKTSYNQPTKVAFSWKGVSCVPDVKGDVAASIVVDVGGPAEPRGLIEKVDVLAEIPYVIKAFVNYVAGTKPYVYQWLNPAELTVTAPAAVIDGSGEGEKTITAKGTLFNEATFIS